jgi:hypothetical protein
VADPSVPAQRLAPDGRPIVGRKLRNWVTALLALVGAVAGSAIVIAAGIGSRLPHGQRLPWADWIFPLAAVAVMLVFAAGYARCYVSFDASTVIVRNPFRRHVLAFDEIEYFRIGARPPFPFMCICRCVNGTEIACVAITNGDAHTRRLVADFNAIVQSRAAASGGGGHRDLPGRPDESTDPIAP